jgi:8-oxo-dGTP pyrophosphatase MutT (NUDIX family)
MDLAGFDRLAEQAISGALMRVNPVIDESVKPAHLVPASVLIPLFRMEERWHLVYTHRTEKVMNHKGQVSFPGGAADPDDRDAVQTALRETYEEIGIPTECVQILGQMMPMPTVTGFIITPVVGVVCWPYELHPAEIEVERVFHVPLAWLADPANWEERLYTRSNGTSEMVVYYQPYDGELIWGATARITLDFIKILAGE